MFLSVANAIDCGNECSYNNLKTLLILKKPAHFAAGRFESLILINFFASLCVILISAISIPKFYTEVLEVLKSAPDSYWVRNPKSEI